MVCNFYPPERIPAVHLLVVAFSTFVQVQWNILFDVLYDDFCCLLNAGHVRCPKAWFNVIPFVQIPAGIYFFGGNLHEPYSR